MHLWRGFWKIWNQFWLEIYGKTAEHFTEIILKKKQTQRLKDPDQNSSKLAKFMFYTMSYFVYLS